MGLTQVISPLIVIRLLSQDEFGIYQGFVAITSVLVVLASLGFDASVVYFLPKAVGSERRLLGHTTRAILTISLFVSVVFLFLSLLGFVGNYRFVFFVQCAAYAFLYANLNWVENYLLVKNRIKALAMYAMARLAMRILAVMGAAFLYRDANAVIWASLVVELIRLACVALWISARSLISFQSDRAFGTHQARYAVPIGLTGIFQALSQHAGKVVVLAASGPTVLALYAVGMYLQVLIRTVKVGIQEAVFPELVRFAADRRKMLEIHRRSTVLQFVLFTLPFVLFSFRGKEYVHMVFPAEYANAVPAVHIFSVLFLRRVFNFDSVFKASGISGFALSGSVVGLAVNGITTMLLWPIIGWYSAAIGYVTSEVIVEVLYFYKAKAVTGATVEELIDLGGLAKCTIAVLIASVLLVVNEMLFPMNALCLAIELVAFVGIAIMLMSFFGVTIVQECLEIVSRHLKQMKRRNL